MNLIKKTVILSGDKTGYVSVIRVGNDVGAKVVGEGFSQGMRVGLKIGHNPTYYAVLDGEKTELTLNVPFQNNDPIGCAITSDGKIISRGGLAVKMSAEPTELPAPETVPDSGADALLDKLSAKDGAPFYNGIREQLDELFVVYPREPNLSDALTGSEWVKINYDGEDYYVVGKITENSRTVLIGYGVPGKKSVPPPKIADEIASWLSVPLKDGYDGYWLIFQDAVTGKIKNSI